MEIARKGRLAAAQSLFLVLFLVIRSVLGNQRDVVCKPVGADGVERAVLSHGDERFADGVRERILALAEGDAVFLGSP